MSQNLLQVNSLTPKVLASQQLSDTNPHAVYTAPSAGAAIIKHGTLCNISASLVSAYVAIVPSGQAYDATHRILHALPIAAGDTFPLNNYLGGVCLGPGDMLYVACDTASALDVVITGLEAQ